jgi:serine/threonine-protein kinase HipA
MEAHADYGLSKPEAEKIVSRTTSAVVEWRREANLLRIPKAEQDLMAPAFEPAA